MYHFHGQEWSKTINTLYQQRIHRSARRNLPYPRISWKSMWSLSTANMSFVTSTSISSSLICKLSASLVFKQKGNAVNVYFWSRIQALSASLVFKQKGNAVNVYFWSLFQALSASLVFKKKGTAVNVYFWSWSQALSASLVFKQKGTAVNV